MNVPTADNRTPCYNKPAFNRADGASHIQARILCRGSKKLDVDACPFIDWCRTERDAAVNEFGVGCLEGTWAGELHGKTTRVLKQLNRAVENQASVSA